MAAFLDAWLPRILPRDCGFTTKVYQGKQDLLKRLPGQLRAYTKSLPSTWRIVVIVDCDEDDCVNLKAKLEGMCKDASLLSRTSSGTNCWQVVTRVVVKDLESWYFGEWEAVASAFPRVSRHIPEKAAFRSPDEIRGKAWYHLGKILARHGYDLDRTGKMGVASAVGAHIDPGRSISPSFKQLARAIAEACGQEE